MGSMIGSGIFIVAADITRQTQSPGLLIVTWIVAASLTLIAALVRVEGFAGFRDGEFVQRLGHGHRHALRA